MQIENFNFSGKKTFVRVDFNVPVDENKNITDDTRIRAAMPTLKKVVGDGGRLIIASHMVQKMLWEKKQKKWWLI